MHHENHQPEQSNEIRQKRCENALKQMVLRPRVVSERQSNRSKLLRTLRFTLHLEAKR